MAVKLEIFGIERAIRMIRNIKEAATNDMEIMRQIGVQGEKITLKHFREEAGPDYRWAPLKKPRARGGSKVLQDTGYLRSATQSYAQQHKAIVYNATAYAIYHNSDAPRSKLPQRKFLWFNFADTIVFAKMYLRWLIRK